MSLQALLDSYRRVDSSDCIFDISSLMYIPPDVLFPNAVKRFLDIPDSFGEKHAKISRRTVTDFVSLGTDLFGCVLGTNSQGTRAVEAH